MKRSIIGRLVTLVALVVLATAGMAAAQVTPPATTPPATTPPATTPPATTPPATTPPATTPPAAGTAHDRAITAAGKSAATPAELAASTLTVNQQVAASCSICYTCGGDWPIYSGTLPTLTAATERDSSCSGDFSTTRGDTIPFLCCR
jgi:hypothetical protein